MMDGDIERIREALHFIPATDRDTRVKIGMAVKAELGDVGFDVWDTWARQDPSIPQQTTKVRWKGFDPKGSIKGGTLFHEAKGNGWRDDGKHQKPTSAEIAERERSNAERAAKDEAEIAQERANTATKAAAVWKAATEARADHPYLARKHVCPVTTMREIEASAAAAILGYSSKSGGNPLTGRLLVVPVKQGDRISTLELIDGEGRKAALAGHGTKAGGYWATELLPGGDVEGLTLLIGEGVATVLSGREASGHPAIASLTDTNLPAVAKTMRERYPAAALLILADLVKATGAPDPHAIEAARSVGGFVAVPNFGADRQSGQTDFNDLARQSGLQAVKGAIEAARTPWPAPQPLLAKVTPETYPLDALPATIRSAVIEVQGFTKAPMPMVASSALAALSLAIQAHADVKRADKLSGPTGLFLLTIAESGERKSTCDSFFTSATRDYDAQQAEAAKPILKDFAAALDAWDAKRGGIKDNIRQLAKGSKSTAGAESELRNLEREKPKAPRVPKLLRGDDTPENLAWVLSREWPSAGVLSSEAGIVLGAHGMGKDSIMRNLGLLNILWDGGTLSIGRRTSESFTVRGARLTMALQVQEATLRSFFDRSGGLARGTGFLARFLVAWPESTQGFRPFTEAPADWPDLATFNRRIAEILKQPAPTNEDGSLTPAMLTLTPAAKAAWIKYHDVIEAELASGGELYDVKDVAAKSADNAVRLAAHFQMFESAGDAIGADAFEGASRIAAWHLNESRRFFGELALPVELANAARLDTWLIGYCRRERTRLVGKNFTRQHGPLRDGAALDAAIRELADLDRVVLDKDGKRWTIQLNPALLSEGKP